MANWWEREGWLTNKQTHILVVIIWQDSTATNLIHLQLLDIPSNCRQATPPGCWLAGGGGMNIHEYSLSPALLCPARLLAVFQPCARPAAAALFSPTLPPFNKRRLLRQIYISMAMEQWLPEYNQNIYKARTSFYITDLLCSKKYQFSSFLVIQGNCYPVRLLYCFDQLYIRFDLQKSMIKTLKNNFQ